MKQIQTRLCKKIPSLILLFFILLFVVPLVKAQPSWTFNAASGASAIYNTWGMPNTVEVINCDMYTDASNGGGPAGSIAAIVWDEYDGVSWSVYALLYDPNLPYPPPPPTVSPPREPFVMNRTLIATDARNPDIAISEASGVSGDLFFNIVYESTSGGVYFKEYRYLDLGNGQALTPTLQSVTGPDQFYGDDSNNAARNPRIDALPRDITYFTGAGANTNYLPLRDYVVTWTETVSSTDKIYINLEQTANPPVNSYAAIQIASGTESDIAGVLRNSADEVAYVSYLDASGDLVCEEWDDLTGSGNQVNSLTLENSVSITGQARLDASNVDQGNNAPNFGVIAQVDVSGHEEIRYYDDLNGTVDFANNDPLDPTSLNEEGYRPAIATGPGPDDYNGYTSEYGNIYYIMGYRLSNTPAPGQPTVDFLAADYDGNANSWSSYQEVGVDRDNHYEISPIAFASSPNCGVGNLTAWVDTQTADIVIAFNLTQATAIGSTYKPGRPTSISEKAKEDIHYIITPNPADKFVKINGLPGTASYIVTDITGKTVAQGTVSPSDAQVDISGLSSGTYIFSFNYENKINRFKLIKQ